MKLSEALGIIATEYEIGCASYFRKLPDDPWQAAHDELESAIGRPEQELDAAVDKFCSDITKLERTYRLLNPITTKAPAKASDAFHYGFAPADSLGAMNEKVVAHDAKRQQHCANCFAKEGLMPYRTKNGVLVPLCKSCRPSPGVPAQLGLGF